jgi:hypothetical protein
VEKNSFGLLELEMANLERFLRRTSLGPLGINVTMYEEVESKRLQ